MKMNPKKIKTKKYNFWMYRHYWRKISRRKNKNKIPELVKKIKYTQNKYIWMKAALE